MLCANGARRSVNESAVREKERERPGRQLIVEGRARVYKKKKKREEKKDTAVFCLVLFSFVLVLFRLCHERLPQSHPSFIQQYRGKSLALFLHPQNCGGEPEAEAVAQTPHTQNPRLLDRSGPGQMLEHGNDRRRPAQKTRRGCYCCPRADIMMLLSSEMFLSRSRFYVTTAATAGLSSVRVPIYTYIKQTPRPSPAPSLGLGR